MRLAQRIGTLTLAGALAATIYGIVRADQSAKAANTKANKAAAAEVVDQSALRTARQLATLADTEEEKSLARQALKLGDRELNLAYDIALRDADAHPPAMSEEAKTIEARLEKAQKLQQGLQSQVTQLTAQAAKATGDRKQALQDQLDLANSALNLATNEVEDAEGDLDDAGGNLRGYLAKQKQIYEDAKKTKDAESLFPSPVPVELGLIHRFSQWSALRQKVKLLAAAKAEADAAAGAAGEQHEALAAQIDAEKFNSPELAAHSTLAGVAGATSDEATAGAVTEGIARSRSHEESREAIANTKAIAYDQQNLSSLDKRAANEKELSDLYGQWMGLVSVRQGSILKRMLTGVAIILALLLIGIFFNTWMEKLLGKLRLDKRRVQTLRAVTRVTLQVAAVLLVLLVIFGPPNQLGTFLGLAGAGLTVALKDFIVGFFGWFVLMGRNGIRLGDWVEINGVTGEVVEIGMFHTVLLETGNWTDSGHPTGRRVTFTNSYAIEGHYFNFSTSGQWLWDELQLSIPADRDPFPLVEAIAKKVHEATQQSAEQAEREWQHAAGSRDLGAISAEPAINVRPAAGGIDVQVRYVTRANERYQMRNKLYQAAVELLGKRVTTSVPTAEPASKNA